MDYHNLLAQYSGAADAVMRASQQSISVSRRRPWGSSCRAPSHAGAEDRIGILRQWFTGVTAVEEVLGVHAGAVGDCHCVTYRFAGDRPDGPFVIAQHARFSDRDGRIGWMRLVCSRFRAQPPSMTARPA